MGIMIQPTKNRFGVYHIRKAVPKHLVTILGKLEIKLTLDTKDVKEARYCTWSRTRSIRTRKSSCAS